MNDQDRSARQRDLVPPERLEEHCRMTVVGVGAIGRQVALQAAAIGVPWLQLIDFDTVETANLGPQGYLEDDVGQPKVEATERMCRLLNRQIEITTVNSRFGRSMEVGNVVMCCVDRIDTRRLIWESVKNRVRLFVDGRMSAEVLRVLTATDEDGHRHYGQTLFSADEAYAGACTARSTIYCASIAAGLMLCQVTRYLRRLPLEPDLLLNLLSTELQTATV